MKVDTYRLFYRLFKNPLIHKTLVVFRWVLIKPTLLLLTSFLGKVTYFKMGTITNKNCDFIKEPGFVKAYAAAMKQQDIETDIWRYHINHWAASLASRLDGDFVECGVYKGSTAMSNIVYVHFERMPYKKYYLIDTFTGMNKEVSTADEYSRLKDEYQDYYQFAIDSFKQFPNVVIVKGIVPEVLPKIVIDKIAYLSIDMNCAYAESEALRYFWPKVVRGGVIVLDDYGWPMCESQRKAADDFAAFVHTMIMCLPNGQGVMVK
jgi:O-methyltransferase